MYRNQRLAHIRGLAMSSLFLLLVSASLPVGYASAALPEGTCGSVGTLLRETMAETGAPGALTGLYTPDGNCLVAKGYADVAQQRAMETTDLFRIGSITKSFVATTVLLLAQENRLHLDDTVDKYLPDLPHAGKISVLQLLGHRSGLPTWDGDEALRNEILQHPEKHWSVDQLIAMVARSPLLFEPGSGYHYSNVGYFILGKIIEQASGDSVANQVQKRIVEPLGLKSTRFLEQPFFQGERIRGYEEKDGTIVDTSDEPVTRVINYDLAYTAGGMVSTLDDLYVFGQALATGKLLSEEMHRRQLPQVLREIRGSHIMTGLGLGLTQTNCWIGHNGAIAGYMANMSYCPDKDIAVIFFFNKFSSLDVAANTADLTAYGSYFKKLISTFFPETLGDMQE